jgi:uncharacterized Zn-binding protein involved in type VI secretion
MPLQARRGDTVIGTGSHGAPDCPHQLIGRITGGANSVKTNGRKTANRFARVTVLNCPHHQGGDFCFGGSSSVFVEGRRAHRVGDRVIFVCGFGTTIQGSSNVTGG